MKDSIDLAAGRLLIINLSVLLFAGAALAQDSYQMPPEALAKLVDAPPLPSASVSPDREHLLLMERSSLPSIAELAEPELRLAGFRINPRNNGPSRSAYFNRLILQTFDGGKRTITGLPDRARIRNVKWSPDGNYLAFTLDRYESIDLYIADVATAVARRLTDASINDVAYGSPIEWGSDSQMLIARIVPPNREAPPKAPQVPTGPIIQENIGKKAPARTYQDLLKNAHDEELFTYYFTSQLVRITVNGSIAPIGDQRLYYNNNPSPDGQYLLVESFQAPYSQLVPAYRFPHRIEVWDLYGNVVRHVDDLPLAEEVPIARGSVPEGIRSIGWRDDVQAALYWTEALDGGDAGVEAKVRDQIFTLEAPFTSEPVELVRLPLRYSGVRWGNQKLALVSEYWWPTRTRRLYSVDPSVPGAEPRLVFDVSLEDRYNDPGHPIMRPTPQGTRVILTPDGTSIFLAGAGASPEGNRPFLRRMDLETGEIVELFRSQAPYYEGPVSMLDAQSLTIVTRRESTTEPPNYFLRDLRAGTSRALTSFPHPYPELAGIQKEVITYAREDSVTLRAELYLPAGYEAERDGPLPAFLWAYPREFKNAAAAGQRTDSPYQFKWVSYSGAVPFVTQGYAIINNAMMPVVGEGDAEPNDSFREQLVGNAKAAIDEGVRRGVVDPHRVAVGGHSYGAFMTANLLAHSDLFRAGIARSGAYNRTLTPFGFQNEERIFWESPETYYNMSPFMHVDKVNEPILLIHGEADNNSGTFPLQSRRYYNALKGLGKTARLVMLPHESHGYRGRESIMHMLWEMNRWLETYVKNTSPEEEVTAEGPPADRSRVRSRNRIGQETCEFLK
jgi:dipeptidyl aminopeptidase/acylaminoacyl peptidase